MTKTIPYEKQTIENPNPIARFAHHTRYKASLHLADIHTPIGGTILDFGAGQGDFLHRFHEQRPDAAVLAYEPYEVLRHPEVPNVVRMEDVAAKSIDTLGTFETLEHVPDDVMDFFAEQAKRICKPEGKIIISVPIMIGLALPIKETCRSILFRRASDYSIVEIARGMLGLPVPRARKIIWSHKGFDYRKVKIRFDCNFELISQSFSPFSSLPGWMNSQAFLVYRLKR